jgi:hypothetical protein
MSVSTDSHACRRFTVSFAGTPWVFQETSSRFFSRMAISLPSLLGLSILYRASLCSRSVLPGLSRSGHEADNEHVWMIERSIPLFLGKPYPHPFNLLRLTASLFLHTVLERSLHSIVVSSIPYAGRLQIPQRSIERENPKHPPAHRYHPQRLVRVGRRDFDQDHRHGFARLVRSCRPVQADARGPIQEGNRCDARGGARHAPQRARPRDLGDEARIEDGWDGGLALGWKVPLVPTTIRTRRIRCPAH